MPQHPIRIDRLDRGSVFLIISEGQPADEYTVPVGFGHHVEGDTRWTVTIHSNRGHSAPHMRTYDTPGPVRSATPDEARDTYPSPVPLSKLIVRGEYFRSWQDVVEFAARCIDGHAADLVQPDPNDVVRWARQAEHDTVIRFDGLAVASEAIRRGQETPPGNASAFRDLERQLGLSKAQTATLCGVHVDTVAKWRSGARGVPNYAVKLLQAEADRRAQESRP